MATSRKAKFIKIMCSTVERWRNTITSSEQPDVDRAKAMLRAAYKNVDVFVVDSPLQFYIAQAIMRGRVAKKLATQWCQEIFNVDPAFIAGISRSGGLHPIVSPVTRWSMGAANSIQAMVLRDFTRNIWSAKTGNPLAVDERPRWRRVDTDAQTLSTRLSDVMELHQRFIRYAFLNSEVRRNNAGAPMISKMENQLSHVTYRINFSPNNSAITRSAMSIYSAIGRHAQDILNNAYDPTAHFHDATQAEMIGKMLGCTDPDVTWRYEILHCVPGILRCNRAFLILGKKPKISLDGNNLHNDAGPAVEWADGNTDWAINGHVLTEHGREIVLTPDKLTMGMINEIANEENRRIAIDRVGWGKYLTLIGAKVIDKQENWVDNTVEALIQPPTASSKSAWAVAPPPPMRMLLSCRSTGRKYFLAVPQEAETTDFKRITVSLARASVASTFPETQTDKITTCAEAQDWFANGALTEFLPYAKHKIRVVGAS